MDRPTKLSWDKVKTFQVPCQYCGAIQTRNKPSTNVTCFDCKVDRRRLRDNTPRKPDVKTVISRNRVNNNKNNKPTLDNWPWQHQPTNR